MEMSKEIQYKQFDNEIEIVQKSSLGSETTQIGVQNVYNGVSVTDAVQMAFTLFKEYYPQLREEALGEIRELIVKEMEKIKVEDVVSPKAKIAIPVLQNASITDEKELRTIYAKLLSSAMNKKVASQIHPAFVNIINQMSEMDAHLLKKIVDINNSIPVANIKFTFDNSYLTQALPHFFSPYFKELGDEEQVSMGIENLSRLQLINLFQGSVVGYDYEIIKTDSYIQERYKFAKQNNFERNLEIEISEYVIQLNDFGRKFVRLCM